MVQFAKKNQLHSILCLFVGYFGGDFYYIKFCWCFDIEEN